jgi:TRAP-type C4-dicarboxylate transport system permease small subunit
MVMIISIFEKLSQRPSNWLEVIAGIALMLVMLLTGCDIVGRAFGMPVLGTYEIVSFAGGLVIGLAVPATSRVKGHVFVDLILERISVRKRFVLKIITRLMGVAVFLLMSYALIRMGNYIRLSGEVTSVLRLPFYPVAYAMGGSFFVECLVLIADLPKRPEVVKHE